MISAGMAKKIKKNLEFFFEGCASVLVISKKQQLLFLAQFYHYLFKRINKLENKKVTYTYAQYNYFVITVLKYLTKMINSKSYNLLITNIL